MRRLANGTFAEDGKPSSEKQLSKVTSFRGGVTYVDADPAAPAYTVSTRGASLLVHTKPDPSGAAPELPAIGAYVTVTAQIGDELSQQKLEARTRPAVDLPRPRGHLPGSLAGNRAAAALRR